MLLRKIMNTLCQAIWTYLRGENALANGDILAYLVVIFLIIN